MKKDFRVTKNQDFSHIIKVGKKFSTPSFIAYHIENNLQHSRFGISVSKKVGNAVTRVRLRRIFRALIDQEKELYGLKRDVIIIVRKEAANQNFQINLEYIKRLKESIDK